MKKIDVMAVVFLFLLSVCVPAFAQEANTAAAIPPILSNKTVPENMDQDNSQLQDEGYGSDDAEYYGAEDDNETTNATANEVNQEATPAQ